MSHVPSPFLERNGRATSPSNMRAFSIDKDVGRCVEWQPEPKANQSRATDTPASSSPPPARRGGSPGATQSPTLPRAYSSASTLVACSPPSSPYQSQMPTGMMSPRLLGSFALDERHQWEIAELEQSMVDTPSQARKRGYQDALVAILESWGWLRGLEPGIRGRIPPLIVFTLEAYVVLTTLKGGYSGLPEHIEFEVIHWYDSVSRHVLIFMAHFAMYFIGGKELTRAFRQPDFALPFGLFSALAILTAIEFMIDAFVFYNRFANDGQWKDPHTGAAMARRIFISMSRLPSACSLIVMMSVPKNLCQDLVRVVMALDSDNIPESLRLYSVFWRRMRVARRWYNYIMTPHFLIALCHLPIGLYLIIRGFDEMTRSGATKSLTHWEMRLLVAYTVVDLLQMFCWISPAMTIRSNHGVALVAAVGQAGLQTASSINREIATMMASLHPIVGLKFLGAIITWRLVVVVSTISSALLGILKWRFNVSS